MPVDSLARGVALLAISEYEAQNIYYARDLRRRIQHGVAKPPIAGLHRSLPQETESESPYDNLDEDLPFGWTPRNEPP